MVEESAHTSSLLLRQDQVLKAEDTRLLDLLKSIFEAAETEEEQEEEQHAPQVGHEGREDGGGGARGGGGGRWISRGVCYDVMPQTRAHTHTHTHTHARARFIDIRLDLM